MPDASPSRVPTTGPDALIITVDEVLDFFHIRTVLEAESARLPARNATATRVRELEKLIVQATTETYRAARAGDDPG